MRFKFQVLFYCRNLKKKFKEKMFKESCKEIFSGALIVISKPNCEYPTTRFVGQSISNYKSYQIINWKQLRHVSSQKPEVAVRKHARLNRNIKGGEVKPVYFSWIRNSFLGIFLFCNSQTAIKRHARLRWTTKLCWSNADRCRELLTKSDNASRGWLVKGTSKETVGRIR